MKISLIEIVLFSFLATDKLLIRLTSFSKISSPFLAATNRVCLKAIALTVEIDKLLGRR